jgi:hypothetical protein
MEFTVGAQYWICQFFVVGQLHQSTALGCHHESQSVEHPFAQPKAIQVWVQEEEVEPRPPANPIVLVLYQVHQHWLIKDFSGWLSTRRTCAYFVIKGPSKEEKGCQGQKAT